MIKYIQVLRIFLLYAMLFVINASYASSLTEVTKESFLGKNPSNEKKLLVNSILNQLDSKEQQAVTQKGLDKIWNNKELRKKLALARFQIIDQKLYADDDCKMGRYSILKSYFLYLVKKYKIKDVDFMIHLGDELNNKSDELNNKSMEKYLNIMPPTFMISKDNSNKYEQSRILIPDAHIINNNGYNWTQQLKSISNTSTKIDWQQKAEKVFWRGGSTGGTYNTTNFDKLDRLKLVMFSKLCPNLIDARFTHYVQFSNNKDGEALKKTLDILFGNKQHRVKPADHLTYKYLISVDGNTSAWERVPWIMYSNSVLIKQDSKKIQWFYPALKPYLHYIPVKKDLTNIFSQLEWMKKNDKQVQKISTNAQKFVRENLKSEDIEKHMVLILNKYSTLQNGLKIKATLPKAKVCIKQTVKSLLKKYMIMLGIYYKS